MIQAAVLAGGFGTRLRPLTRQVPKPLLPVRGKPFLQHQLDLLKLFGVVDILLLIAYLGWKIEEYFGDGSRLGLRIEYSREQTPLGTAGALRNAEDKLQSDFLLLNGDTFLSIDFRELLEHYHKKRPWGLMIAFENPDKTIPNNLALDDDWKVTAYNKRDPSGLTHVDAGGAVFSRRILELVPPGRVCSLEEEIYPRLIERGKLWAFPTRQPFYDIGTFEGLEALAQVLR